MNKLRTTSERRTEPEDLLLLLLLLNHAISIGNVMLKAPATESQYIRRMNQRVAKNLDCELCVSVVLTNVCFC